MNLLNASLLHFLRSSGAKMPTFCHAKTSSIKTEEGEEKQLLRFLLLLLLLLMSLPLFDVDAPVKKGWAVKQGHVVKNWKRR